MKRHYFEKHHSQIKFTVKKIVKIVLFSILGCGVAILFGFITMWLWNRLLTDIFSLREITYWEGVGLVILAKIFFGGFGGSHDSKKEISQKIDQGIDEGMDKEFSKNDDATNTSNENYEAMYEKWWKEKGEKNFSEYMDSKGD